ncbi:low molecular weight phosphatase family protein [Cryptosporangium sp. NPDC048952]|uniref:arsenate reductase/protein-tyrosine-phosphatase family protein n=1 Tax=Cryptosporangium sp. NPDC048952 TaxID=3363961 RepID=UPI00372451E9
MGGILHVCTGNLCRSPIAERLMDAGLHARYGDVANTVVVSSAGTSAPVGQPIHPLAAAELTKRGVGSGDFSARRLEAEAAERADLLLTATRRHRDRIIAANPPLLGRVFTWRELAWLVDGLGNTIVRGEHLTDRVRNLPRAAGMRRGYLRPPPPDEFDVRDPMGGTEQDFKQAAAEIDDAVVAILAVL